MACGSPCYIFKGLTVAELLVLRTTFLARISGGTYTSLSGQGHSASIEYMDPQQGLIEVNYALGQLGVAPYALPPQTVYQQFTGIPASVSIP